MPVDRALTPRQARFVDEYLLDLNATKAAIRAGYAPKAAQPVSSRLLSNAIVARAIAIAQAARAERTDIQQDRVLRVAAELLFVPLPNIGDLFDEQDNLRPLHTLTRAQTSMISAIEIVKKNLAAGDGHTDLVHKLKLWDVRADKTKALELVMRHLGLFEGAEDRDLGPVFVFPPGTHVDMHTQAVPGASSSDRGPLPTPVSGVDAAAPAPPPVEPSRLPTRRGK